MINRTVLTGRLTKDVEIRYTNSGAAVASMTVAVNRTFKSEGQPDADFINVIAWKRQAENAAKFRRKGSLVGIDGRIQTRNYEGQDGRRVFVTEVVAESVQFLEPKQGGNGGGSPFNNQQNDDAVDISYYDLPF